jgi:hypothetical protein
MGAESAGVLDSVEKGIKLSEAGYGVIEDPVSGDYRRSRTQRPFPSRWCGIELTLDSRRKPCSRCLVRGQSPRQSDLAKRRRVNDGPIHRLGLYPAHSISNHVQCKSHTYVQVYHNAKRTPNHAHAHAHRASMSTQSSSSSSSSSS